MTEPKPKDIPAFPCVIKDREFPNNSELERLPGMTLRDYFACHIAQAISGNLHMYKKDLTNEDIAIRAYSVADAMLAEREKSNDRI